MKPHSKNESGFTAVEGLLIILVLAIIGFGGYYVWHTQHKAKPGVAVTTTKSTSPTSNKSPSSSPYAGWKTYTLTLEKLTFRYPSTWSLVNNSDSTNDDVELNGTNGFEIRIGAGQQVSAINNYSGNCNSQADPVTFDNQSAYLDLNTVTQFNSNDCAPASNPTTIGQIILSNSSSEAYPTNFLPTKNIARSTIVVVADYNGPNFAKQNIYQTISYIENDTNYKDAKLIVDSMSY